MCVLFSGKVFSKLNYTVPKSTIKEVAECKPRVIEVVLANLRMKVSRFMNFFLTRPLDMMNYAVS